MNKTLPVAGVAAVAVLLAAAAPAAAVQTPGPGHSDYIHPRDAHSRIVDGHAASENYPWNVTEGEFFHECGGALIAPGWVISAAHCAMGFRPGRAQVRIGSQNTDSGGETVKAASWVKHPTLDVALLKLDGTSRAQLATVGPAPSVGSMTRIIGYGRTQRGKSGASSKTLQEMDIKIVDNSQCADGEIVNGLEFCVATDKGESGACAGDSGSPEIVKVNGRWTLIGVTSRGPSDCTQGGTIYTNLAAIAPWINQNAGTHIPENNVPVPAPTTERPAPTTDRPAPTTEQPAPTEPSRPTAGPTSTRPPKGRPKGTPSATAPVSAPPSTGRPPKGTPPGMPKPPRTLHAQPQES